MTTAALLLLCCFPSTPSVAANGGRLEITVVDGGGEALAGATVSLPDLGLSAATDLRGVCRLAPIPEGSRRLVVTHLGYGERTVEVEAVDDRLVRATVPLEILAFRESVTIRDGPLEEGRARSLHRQREADRLVEILAADQIGRFPDLDAAAAVQRLPGALALRDQGEPRHVVVRGLPASYTSARVDGERIPSGEADERIVALDLLPTELLETVELSKTPTPDQDGDWIGGALDLVTRTPPRGRQVAFTAGRGVDEATDGPRRLGTFVLGDRRAPNGAGALLAASHLDVDRGVDAWERVLDDGETDLLRFQDSEIDRRRRGVTAALDVPGNEGSLLSVRGLWSELHDRELRRRRELRLGDGIRGQEVKDRTESLELTSARTAGLLLVGSSALVEVRGAWNRAEEDEPTRFDTIFVEEGVELGEAVDPDPAIDPANLFLEEIRREADFASVQGWSAAADLTLPLPAHRGTVRLGAKVRSEDAARDDDLFTYEGDDAIRLIDVLDAGWHPAEPFEVGPAPAGLELGPFSDPGRTEEILSLYGLEAEKDLEEDLGDYRATEEIAAAYGRLDLDLSDRLSFVGGLRWERTETDYSAFELIVAGDDEERLSLVPTRGGASGSELLPMAQLRWALTGDDLLRLSLARTLVRPDLGSLAPFRLVLEDEEEIELGNPELRPTTAWNLDLAWERSLAPLGRLSVAFFAKDLRDVIVTNRSRRETGDGEITVLQPRNAGDAELVGVELAFEQSFRSLPPPFDGLGLAVSATGTRADTNLPSRPGTELPGQAGLFGQAALSWEKAGFSARLAWVWRDRLVEELGDEPAEDVWLEERGQLDLSVRQRITSRWSVFLEALDLTDEPLRRTLGPSGLPVAEERYGRRGMLGVRFDL